MMERFITGPDDEGELSGIESTKVTVHRNKATDHDQRSNTSTASAMNKREQGVRTSPERVSEKVNPLQRRADSLGNRYKMYDSEPAHLSKASPYVAPSSIERLAERYELFNTRQDEGYGTDLTLLNVGQNVSENYWLSCSARRPKQYLPGLAPGHSPRSGDEEESSGMKPLIALILEHRTGLDKNRVLLNTAKASVCDEQKKGRVEKGTQTVMPKVLLGAIKRNKETVFIRPVDITDEVHVTSGKVSTDKTSNVAALGPRRNSIPHGSHSATVDSQTVLFTFEDKVHTASSKPSSVTDVRGLLRRVAHPTVLSVTATRSGVIQQRTCKCTKTGDNTCRCFATGATTRKPQPSASNASSEQELASKSLNDLSCDEKQTDDDCDCGDTLKGNAICGALDKVRRGVQKTLSNARSKVKSSTRADKTLGKTLSNVSLKVKELLTCGKPPSTAPGQGNKIKSGRKELGEESKVGPSEPSTSAPRTADPVQVESKTTEEVTVKSGDKTEEDIKPTLRTDEKKNKKTAKKNKKQKNKVSKTKPEKEKKQWTCCGLRKKKTMEKDESLPKMETDP